MKPLSLALVATLSVALAACRGPFIWERTSSSQPSPSPVAANPTPSPTAPGDTSAWAVEAPQQSEEPSRPAAARPATPRAQAESRPAPVRAPEPAAEAEPARSAEAAPPATVPPRRPAVVLPAGTELSVVLSDAVSSDKSRPEEPVRAELAEEVRVNGRVVFEAGTEVRGFVAVAQRSGRVKGRARLVVDFAEIRVPGHTYPIEAERWDVTAASSKGRDAKIAGGAAAAGALIGAITGGKKGAVKGGVIGGAAGGAAVLATRGNEVELRAGAPFKVTLRRPLRIE